MKELFKLKGEVQLELFEKEKLIDVIKVRNTITTLGKEAIISQLMITPDKVGPGWFELGTGEPTATLLGSYISGSRLPITYTGRNGLQLIMVVNYAEGVATGSITEAGIFNVGTENTAEMLASSKFNAINKSDLQSLLVTWKWIIS